MRIIRPVIKKFLGYSAVGIGTFVLDIFLYSYLLQSGVQYLSAAAIAFLFSITLNYVLSRSWVFGESDRHFGTGYVYFIAFAFLGAALTATFLYTAVKVFAFNYLTGRVSVAGLIGILNFFANYFLNFQIQKKVHLSDTLPS